MVGLMEWVAIELLKPHLDDGEGSLGTHNDVSHLAATPPGFEVTVDAEVTAVEGKRVWFDIKAHDGIDDIGKGRHERAIVTWQKFNARVAEKAVRQ
jgi:fluoroacetyl-CoA thioesterase